MVSHDGTELNVIGPRSFTSFRIESDGTLTLLSSEAVYDHSDFDAANLGQQYQSPAFSRDGSLQFEDFEIFHVSKAAVDIPFLGSSTGIIHGLRDPFFPDFPGSFISAEDTTSRPIQIASSSDFQFIYVAGGDESIEVYEVSYEDLTFGATRLVQTISNGSFSRIRSLSGLSLIHI